MAVTAVTGMVIAAMASSAERRGCSAVSDWASRTGGRCETRPDAFDDDSTTGEWTLPTSPRFSGTILAVAHRNGFEVGIACYEQPHGEDATSHHTAFLVRLAEAHQHVRLNTWRLRPRSTVGIAEAVAARVAALPARPESVEVQDRELRIVYYGWSAEPPRRRTAPGPR